MHTGHTIGRKSDQGSREVSREPHTREPVRGGYDLVPTETLVVRSSLLLQTEGADGIFPVIMNTEPENLESQTPFLRYNPPVSLSGYRLGDTSPSLRRWEVTHGWNLLQVDHGQLGRLLTSRPTKELVSNTLWDTVLTGRSVGV